MLSSPQGSALDGRGASRHDRAVSSPPARPRIRDVFIDRIEGLASIGAVLASSQQSTRRFSGRDVFGLTAAGAAATLSFIYRVDTTMLKDLFGQDVATSRERVRPKEPLFTLLCTSPHESVVFLLGTLQRYADDSELDDLFPEVGLTRRDYIEQVHLAIDAINASSR